MNRRIKMNPDPGFRKGTVIVGPPDSKAVKFRDLQKDLDDHLDTLVDCQINEHGSYESVETGVDIAYLFHKVIECRIGDDAHHWADRMVGTRIPTLRRIANIAGEYGLSELAGIVRKHIILRKFPWATIEKRKKKAA